MFIENIKPFQGSRTVDLTLTRPNGSHAGWTVLAGRNGAGKTTLLRALALALSGPAPARGLVQGFEDWVTWGAPEGRVEAGIVKDADFDSFGAPQRMSDSFSAGLKCVSPDGMAFDRETLGRRRGQPALSEIQFPESPHDLSARKGPWADNPDGWFCAGYGPFRRLSGGSAEVQRLMLASGPVARQASLFHADASLAESVSWLTGQHLRALEGREGAAELKLAALNVLQDGLLPDGYRIVDADSDGLWVERSNRRFPLREMSDGFRAVAALVVDILRQLYEAFGDYPVDLGKAPGIVLIDEIEAHLHVSWQRRIGPWLTSHFPNIQFIVTTHSPYICQAADPGGLIRLPGVDEDAAPDVVSDDLYERVVYGSGDDAVLSDLFGLDTPYSERAERVRAEFVALESKVYDGDTSPDTVERYQELKNLLSSSPAARVQEMSAQLHRIAEEIGDGEGGETE
ncbi:AAA family ATPase [Streptomyces sp. NBC_00893]|uniref:AAA family ATPase n=1 Tax=Streptomyces sp. NBC_00893 TaxID=2975862 RepID=UPI00225882E4|nr:ATP-binding protein [Streptomyces sp. NBC_00893]MCX4847923.1 ATP-binding protein [Streptomyces sp. NBC_00893]